MQLSFIINKHWNCIYTKGMFEINSLLFLISKRITYLLCRVLRPGSYQNFSERRNDGWKCWGSPALEDMVGSHFRARRAFSCYLPSTAGKPRELCIYSLASVTFPIMVYGKGNGSIERSKFQWGEQTDQLTILDANAGRVRLTLRQVIWSTNMSTLSEWAGVQKHQDRFPKWAMATFNLR